MKGKRRKKRKSKSLFLHVNTHDMAFKCNQGRSFIEENLKKVNFFEGESFLIEFKKFDEDQLRN